MKFAAGCALVAAFVLSVAAPARAQSFPWWKSEPFKKEVGLTPDQCAKIDAIFQAALPGLRATKQDLDRQEAELSTLIEANSDEPAVLRQVDRVESTRGALNKMRTTMLLHMRQVLTPEQRVRFKSAHDQWEKDRHAANPQSNPRN